MILWWTALAFADGDAHNPLGVRLRPAGQDVFATYDAAHVSRREIDTLDPVDAAYQFAYVRAVEHGGWQVSASLRGSQAYGIGDVTAACDATNLRTTFECPRNQTTRDVSVDAMASGLTIAAHNGRFGFAYSGSVNQLQLEPRTAQRPIYPQVYSIGYGALTPLLLVADRAGVTETAGFPRAAHLLTGGYRDGDRFEARIGSTLSLRPYVHLAVPDQGLVAETLLRGDFSGLRALKAGAEAHRWGDEDAGASTLLIRKVDLIDVRRLRNQTTLANLDALDALSLWWLQAGHDDIVGLFDVHAQATLTPDVAFLDVTAGAHTRSWHRDTAAFGLGGYGGLVGLPKIPGYDAPRSLAPSVGIETRFPFGRPGFVGQVRVAWNDPTLITVLPYSASALHASFSVRTP